MTTTLTDAERTAMREVATDALDRGAWYHAHGHEMEPPTCEETLAADVLSLLALYEASQAALTGALAELTAARAEHSWVSSFDMPEPGVDVLLMTLTGETIIGHLYQYADGNEGWKMQNGDDYDASDDVVRWCAIPKVAP